MRALSFNGFRAVMRYNMRMLATVSFSRLLNLLRTQGSYVYSSLTKSVHHSGKPLAVSIEPTTSCNLRCPECPTGAGTMQRHSGSLGIAQFKSLLAKLPAETSYLTLYFQGEPFLNRHFFDMVRLAKQRRMIVATSTNGHFLDLDNATKVIESGLDKIIISLDGADEETYLNYRRGGDFEKVISGLRNLALAKKERKSHSPLIVLQFLVFRQNEMQLNQIRLLGKELGADVLEIKTAQHYNFRHGSDLMTTIDKYSRYRKTKSGEYELKKKLRNRCLRMWTSCVITWDGNIAPCCFDKDAKHSYGNLFEQEFDQIWKAESAQKFRKRLWRSRKQIEMCLNCHE
jgi:radical SAM protein with 4Fe4S-binding SPASM domain